MMDSNGVRDGVSIKVREEGEDGDSAMVVMVTVLVGSNSSPR
jgi:hypothetical protein